MAEVDACKGYPTKDWGEYCMEPPCGLLDPTLDKSYDVVKAVFEELQDLFPGNKIHIGADEVVTKCWDLKPSIKEFMTTKGLADYGELLQYYLWGFIIVQIN